MQSDTAFPASVNELDQPADDEDNEEDVDINDLNEMNSQGRFWTTEGMDFPCREV